MSHVVRDHIVASIKRLESRLSDIADWELSMPQMPTFLETQLSLLESLRVKFREVQDKLLDEVRESQEAEKDMEIKMEIMSLCDTIHNELQAYLITARAANPKQESAGSTSDVLALMKDLMVQSEIRHQQQLDAIVATFVRGSQQTATNNGRSHSKLPQLSLPKFDGKFTEWISFRDRFNSSVTSHPNITAVQKLEYLQGALTGVAAAEIESLPLTEENFEVAWKILEDKFQRKNEIVAEHIKLFTAMPSVTSNSPNAIHQISARFSKTIMALDAMSVTQRDPWLIYFVLEKLDSESRVLWGRECGADVPTIEHFKKFLNQRCIDNLNANEKSKGSSSTPSKPQPSKPSTKKSNVTALNTTVVSAKCNCCQETNHPLYKCSKFLSQTPAERLETVKTLKLCKNCFAHHYTSSCTFRKCRKCHSKHNVLLHDSSVNSLANPTPSTSRSDTPANSDTRDTPPSTDTNPSPSVVAISSTIGSDLSGQPPKVFLATAMTYILTANNEKLPCRVILDGGAQINVMTTSLYQKLNLPKQSVGFNVSGVNDRRSAIKYSTEATIISPTSGVTFTLTCCLLPKIASNIPNWKVDEDAIGIPPGVVLADPDWAKQKPVDLLVCGNAYWESWLADTISLGPGLPVLKETVFGYVVVGEHTTSTSQQTPFYNNLTVSAIEDSAKLDESIKRFWELEDLPKDSTPTIDEHVEAERHFVNTHKRAPDGRFIVRLPFKKDPSTLGYSRQRAMQQFMALERKFDKNPLLQSMYSDVIHDYLKRGWLEPVPVHSLRDPSYYMPHHGVMKEASTTTKLRIVNNGSAKTSSGLSLNDILMTGPTVQPDLASILLRFRQHPYALTADISKMYLQLMLDPAEANFQRILWRDSRDSRIAEFRITRVCFGLASSPFLATRALNQLAMEHEASHPLASDTLRTAFYVDDCVISVETKEQALETQLQLVEVLEKGGFSLAKWASNDPELIPEESSTDSEAEVPDVISALGMRWNTKSDVFEFICPISKNDTCITKRDVASLIARLFDPLGLIGPVVVEAKMLLQDLHEAKLKWDTPISPEHSVKWTTFVNHLQHIVCIKIPRWLSSIHNPSQVVMHAFCDASSRAYGAVLYLVTSDSNGFSLSRLIASKSRIAPIGEVTIPKLELCGATLAAELVSKVKDYFTPQAIHFWTDAMVVLHWIHSPPDVFKIFISKRIKTILSLSSSQQWRHVSTKLNPADLISRGATPMQLKISTLWWNGPYWLTLPEEHWPPSFNGGDGNCKESMTAEVLLTPAQPADSFESTYESLRNQFRTFNKIVRIRAYVFKFFHNCRSEDSRRRAQLSPLEHERALQSLIADDQDEAFPGLKDHLRNGTLHTSKWKNLASLAPFVDDHDLVRVGGRLSRSPEDFNVKFPILLPKTKLTHDIAEREHVRQLHAGPTLRQRYWPLSGRNLTRKICHQCIRCFRARPRLLEQIMADLPPQRVTFTRPFHSTGIDYAGPVVYRLDASRSARRRHVGVKKAYISVFVCLATKAVHLELVTKLSTEAFLAAYRRFAARRNTPRHIFSDCGKNFAGAANELSRLISQEDAQQEIADRTREDGTIWHFNPPNAPHHGGLWEASVKRVKHHLNRVSQHAPLTFEEFYTVLTQIEAILNSRPLCLLSSDPNGRSYLTPGHFLTFCAGNSPPDPDVTNLSDNRLSHWQLCQKRAQEFGKKFREMYLNTLQQRGKWLQEQTNVQPGDIVLLLDESAEDSKWILGQVEETFPGVDQRVRVVTVRTSRGLYRRPITKIAKLPIQSPESTQDNEEEEENLEQID
ncbi:uncharacterized protein LOC129808897 [Phlebotomus papatasi]|uniref:uncharacterized protein LOC129808897 n=1 Tax=Phlebotomus papatasi TaxID=29031 RepID=UPI0024835B81|nr:uncharacterized protein LOC129808897 [Phlebotomus papatasi]